VLQNELKLNKFINLLGRAADERSQRSRGRARSQLGSLDLSLLTADFLLDGLLEPCLHTVIPVLVKVLVGNDYIKIECKHKSTIQTRCSIPLLCLTIFYRYLRDNYLLLLKSKYKKQTFSPTLFFNHHKRKKYLEKSQN
jgi:hypothetical protein